MARLLGYRGWEEVALDGTAVKVLWVRTLVPRWAEAQTWGRVVLVREGVPLEAILPHEAVHVAQWRRYPWSFPIRYLWGSLGALLRGEDPYWGNPFEEEAYRFP